jgi:hypothetical protein
MPYVGKAPRLDDPNDGADHAVRRVAVVCPQRLATTIVSAIDALARLLDGPRNAPPRTLVSLDGVDRAGAAAATPLSGCILSP